MNKLKCVLLFLLFIILIGCNSKVTEEDLIGGNWEATAGYKDGKPEGEPYCLPYVEKGLEFKSGDTVYSEYYEKEFEYRLKNTKNGIKITFMGENKHDSYYIDKVEEDKVGLKGASDIKEDESCYLERK